MKTKRDGLEIRIDLLRRGKTIADVAALAGVSRPLASITVNGHKNNRRVLRALLSMGVPRRLLNLPNDMMQGKEAA